MVNYEQFLEMNTNDLLLQLGAQSMASITSMDNDANEEAKVLIRRVAEEGDDERARLIGFGARVLKRMSVKLHGILCANSDANIAGELEAALKAGKIALATFFSTTLVSFGVPVPVAALVASILAITLSESLYEELCSTWDGYNGQL